MESSIKDQTEQINETRKSLPSFYSKFSSALKRLSPKQLLIIALIALAIPLTVILALQQQNLRKEPSTTGQAAAAVPERPNIVIVMLDDVNPMDGRFFTAERTPNIYSNIVATGINFTNLYGETSLCCPGRAGYLSGQHTQNHGVDDLEGTKFNPATTIATELQGIGYYTMLTGKYLNKYRDFPVDKLTPPGWDEFDAIYQNNGKYYNYDLRAKDGTIVHYGEAPSDYSTDVFANKSLDRIKAAPPTKPIFAYLNPFAIHTPHTQAPRHIGNSRCANIPAWNAPNVNEADTSDKAAFIRDLPVASTPYDIKVECEMLLSVDEWVGRVAAELKAQGRYDNTIFILTADNGEAFQEHNIPAKTVPYTTHVPLYISWPAGRGLTPRVEQTTLSNIDFAPTFCELAGCIMGPYPNGQQSADGPSFAALIKDQAKNFTRDAILESQPIVPAGTAPSTRPAWWAIRTTEDNSLGLWHYIEWDTGEKELYDLSGGPCYNWSPGASGDPCELDSMLSPKVTPSQATLDLVAKLKTRLNELKVEKGLSASPTPTPTPDPNATPTPTPATLSCTAPVIISHSDTNPTGGGTVSFAWNAVEGASQYRVQRQKSDGTWNTRATASSTSFTGSDISIDPNWRVFVYSGSCTPLPGPSTVFDP